MNIQARGSKEQHNTMATQLETALSPHRFGQVQIHSMVMFVTFNQEHFTWLLEFPERCVASCDVLSALFMTI